MRRLPALALLGALALGAAACGGDDGGSGDTTTSAPPETTTTVPPSTTEPPGAPIDPAVLGVGDCFEDRVIPGQGATDVDETQTVQIDCNLPHRNEVYLVTQMPDEPGTPFPGAEAVDEFATGACLDAFESFVGVEYVVSVWEIGYTIPTEETWPLPDRQVTCFVFNRDNDKVAGSARGSRQ